MQESKVMATGSAYSFLCMYRLEENVLLLYTVPCSFSVG